MFPNGSTANAVKDVFAGGFNVAIGVTLLCPFIGSSIMPFAPITYMVVAADGGGVVVAGLGLLPQPIDSRRRDAALTGRTLSRFTLAP
jgi:hypothetical protein